MNPVYSKMTPFLRGLRNKGASKPGFFFEVPNLYPDAPCREYLPTLSEKWPHSRGNVGNYSLHGAYGIFFMGIYISRQEIPPGNSRLMIKQMVKGVMMGEQNPRQFIATCSRRLGTNQKVVKSKGILPNLTETFRLRICNHKLPR